MKLTNQQITQIEEALVLNGINFDDIKLEVTDHIASEIEEKISNEGISFEVAFKEIFEKWKPELRPCTSVWVGTNNAFPRIIMDKWILESKKQLLKGSLTGAILAVLFSILARIINNETIFETLRVVLKAIFIVEFIFILVSKVLIWKSTQPTSSGFIFQKQTHIAALIWLFMLGIGLFPLRFVLTDFKVGISQNFLFIVYLIWPIRHIQLAYKHFQFNRKFKIS